MRCKDCKQNKAVVSHDDVIQENDIVLSYANTIIIYLRKKLPKHLKAPEVFKI